LIIPPAMERDLNNPPEMERVLNGPPLMERALNIPPPPKERDLNGPPLMERALDDDRNSGDDDSEEENRCSHPTKRSRTPQKWKENIAATQRASGLPYLSKSGKQRPAVKQKMSHECRRDCYSKLLPETRRELFIMFRQLNRNEQSAYLLGLRTISKAVRVNWRGVKNPMAARKFETTWRVNGEQVCKKAICDLFGWTAKRIRLLKAPAHSATLSTIRAKSRQKPGWIRQAINDHIIAFHAQQAHYSRANNPHRLYIVSDDISNVRDMWQAFINLHSDEEPVLAAVKYEYYYTHCVTHHNIGFGQPASDTCTLCDVHEAQEQQNL